MSTDPPETIDDLDALRAALRAENTAVHGYGFIGARSSGGERTRASDDLDAHRAQRDAVRDLILGRDADPPGAEAGYDVPEATDEAALAEFAADLEWQCSQCYLELSAAGDPALRDAAHSALAAATVRALTWGADLPPFPGFPGGEL